MRNSSTSPTRRLAAAVATLGVTAALATGCSKDDPAPSADGSSTSAAGSSAASGAPGAPGSASPSMTTDANGNPVPVPAPGQTDANGSTVSVAPQANGDPNVRPAGAPTAPLEQLVINSTDAPELGLTGIPQEQIAQSAQAMGGMAQNSKVDPPACQELTRNALADQAAPNTVAVQSGQVAGAVVSVGVTSNPDKMPDRAKYMDQCKTMTMTMPMPNGGGQAVTKATTTQLDLKAPEGVDKFFAARQDSTSTLGQTTQQSGAVTITGTVRGIGVSISTASLNGPASQEQTDGAMAAFVKQVEKIKKAS